MLRAAAEHELLLATFNDIDEASSPVSTDLRGQSLIEYTADSVKTEYKEGGREEYSIRNATQHEMPSALR